MDKTFVVYAARDARRSEISTGSATQHGGVTCPSLSETQTCGTGPCPVHCDVSVWGSWTACTLTCGGGTQTRSRSVVTHADHGGYTCPSVQEVQSCNHAECPVDCVQTAWSGWTSCSLTCGTGSQMRTRSITTMSQHGGVACAHASEERVCSSQACPIDCMVTDWSGWGDCTASCGGGAQTRSRSIAACRKAALS